MSRSRKHFPGGTCCVCKSQKWGKQVSSRKFRRRTKVHILKGDFGSLPRKSFELMPSWGLGGDGKSFYGFHPECDWYIKVLRK